MTSFDAWALMVGGMSLFGGVFVLWFVARVEARERTQAAHSHAAE